LSNNADISGKNKPIFIFKFLAIKWLVQSEATTIGKLELSTFRLYPIYTYDGPTPGSEIALQKDQANRRLFPDFRSTVASKMAKLL
jgi:hypothetical protein